jgi:rhomboid protease GluP
MLRRQRTGSVICPSCGNLVGVRDAECLNCGRKNPGMWGFASAFRRINLSFTAIVMWGCGALYVATLIMDPRGIGMNGTSILSPSQNSLVIFGASGAGPVFLLHRWWTVLSAAWLHGNIIHIFFNLLWIRQLAPAVEELYGASRAIIIYTIASIAGFLLSSVLGTGLTVGASAPIFGLLGALVLYGRRAGSSHIGSQAMTYAVVLFVFGFIMPNVDNFAHFGGFVGGFGTAFLLDPLRRERGDHWIAAIICLTATALSIIASVVTAFGVFRG